MKSGLYANKRTLKMFYVIVVGDFAMVTMLLGKKEVQALLEVSYMLATGSNNFYVGKV